MLAAGRAAWSAKYAREPTPWRGPARFAPAVAAALDDLPRGARVLELGAGGGKAAAALLARGFTVVALDFARTGLASVDERAARVEALAERLPLRDAAFDAVLARHVLAHVPAHVIDYVCDEARRALVPGGVFLFEDFAAGDMRAAGGDGGLPRASFDEPALRALLAAFDVRIVERVVVSKRYGERAKLAAVAQKFAEPSSA
ncbi:MAG: methyltransferase domain-containing protein [Thermoplasmatota archaeon]